MPSSPPDAAVFARDLRVFAPALEGWAKRARHFGIDGLEKCFLDAAESAASWSRTLAEED